MVKVKKWVKIKLRYLFEHEKISFLLYSIFLSFEYVILGPYSYVRIGDNMDSVIPKAVTIWSTFSFVDISYWYPLLAGGVDRLANEMLYSSIHSLFFAVFPVWLAYGLLLIGGFYIGGLYMFRLCNKILSFGKGASIFAGTVFAFTLILSDIIPYILGLSILPVAIYYLEIIFSRLEELKMRKYLYSIILGFIFSLFSSLILVLPFTLVAIAVWFIIVRKKYKFSFLVVLFLFAVSSIILSIQELWALLINVSLSQRGSGYFNAGIEYYLKQIYNSINWIWISTITIIVGIIVIKLKSRFLKLMMILTGIFLFIPPLYKPITTLWGNHFGVFQNFDFSRFKLLLPFFSVIGAAYIFLHIKGFIKINFGKADKNKVFSLRVLVLSMVIIIILVMNLSLKIGHAKHWFVGGSLKSNSYSPDLQALEELSDNNSPFRVATISDEKTTLIPSIVHFHNFESIDSHTNMTSKRYINYFRLLAKDPTLKSSLYLFWHASDQDKEHIKIDSTEFINMPLLSLANTRYVISSIPLSSPNLSLIQTPSSENYYDWEKLNFSNKVKLRLSENFKGRKLLIYENKGVFPRFFLIKKTKIFKDNASLLESLSEVSIDQLKEAVFLEAEDINRLPKIVLSGTRKNVELKMYSPDEIRLTVKSDGPSILVITNTFNPFWNAYVNGKKIEIFHAYHTFMGVLIKDNENEVVLKYEPSYSVSEILKK